MKASKATWLINYENVDVTDELAPHILTVEYVDHLKGKSDELTLTVQNRDQRWFNGWFPSEGDRISCKMGYEDEPLIDCGEFKVDQVDFTTGTDTVQIKALAAGVALPIRTTQNRAFENATLKAIAAQLAGGRHSGDQNVLSEFQHHCGVDAQVDLVGHRSSTALDQA